MESPTPAAVVAELRDAPEARRAALCTLVRDVALGSAAARRPDFASRFHAPAAETMAVIQSARLTPADAETPFGNVLSVLEHGPENVEQRMMLGALLALGVAEELPEHERERSGLAAALVWLAAHTSVDALSALDEVMGEGAAPLWDAIALVARDPESVATDFGRTEGLTAAAALAASESELAHRARLHLSQSAQDPAVRALASGAVSANAGRLEGELALPPFGPVVTALLTVTLLLFVFQFLRLLLRTVLAFKRPASLSIGPNGLELSQRTELLGQVLRERSVMVPLGSLVRVTREVRYARVGVYAGLSALVLGSYLGTGLLVDAVRVPGGSASLFGLAVLMMLVGLGLDFALSTAADSARGRCRVLVVQQRGRALCLASLDPARADAMLASIAEAARA